MTRAITWPTREEWQAEAEQSERTSCFPRQRVSSDPTDWISADEMDEGRKLAAKLVRATRIALGKADRVADRYDMNDWSRRAVDEDADVGDVASGWWQIARYARSVDVMPGAADRLTALSESMRQKRNSAADAAEEQAVAKAVVERATDEAWEKELKRRARVERGPQVAAITVHEDGSSTVSEPVPFRPPWLSC